MGFSNKQLAALRRRVDERHVRTRELNGRELSYLEGWYAISAANRIFGYDAWSRETLEAKCVLSRENRGFFLAVYTAKVRITVLANGTQVIREGHGTAEGRGTSPGEAHDTALKAAETDATKRALVTFGKPFGLELYRSENNLRSAERAKKRIESRQPLLSPPDRADSPLHEALCGLPGGQSPSTAPVEPNAMAADRPPLDFPVLPPAGNPVGPVTGPADPELPGSAPNLQPLQAEPPLFQNAKPHPDDGTPIPRPSTHFGLENYLATRDQRGALIKAAGREAFRAERQIQSKRSRSGSVLDGNSQASSRSTGQQTPGKIDKSALALPEPKRLRDKNHLKFVASHPCVICGRQPADPHHVRFAQPRAIGMKVSDEFTVPLCRSHHRNLHQAGNEVRWWENFRIEPLPIARKLWEETHPSLGPKEDSRLAVSRASAAE